MSEQQAGREREFKESSKRVQRKDSRARESDRESKRKQGKALSAGVL